MHVYSIEVIPTACELVLDPALETSTVPSKSAPGKRCLHPVPLRPEPAFPRYVATDRPEGRLAQVTRPPTRDWDRLVTRWERQRIPPPTVCNEVRHNAMATLSEGSKQIPSEILSPASQDTKFRLED